MCPSCCILDGVTARGVVGDQTPSETADKGSEDKEEEVETLLLYTWQHMLPTHRSPIHFSIPSLNIPTYPLWTHPLNKPTKLILSIHLLYSGWRGGWWRWWQQSCCRRCCTTPHTIDAYCVGRRTRQRRRERKGQESQGQSPSSESEIEGQGIDVGQVLNYFWRKSLINWSSSSQSMYQTPSNPFYLILITFIAAGASQSCQRQRQRKGESLRKGCKGRSWTESCRGG